MLIQCQFVLPEPIGPIALCLIKRCETLRDCFAVLGSACREAFGVARIARVECRCLILQA